ncbi:MAG: CvpA family protein [Chloroflexi bacterium]|nr:CvpA family protein [Chloroflexota bacterium]
MIATLIANVARKALSLILLGWLDRAAGTVLGFVVGGLFASVIVFLLDKLPLAQANSWVAGSGLAAFFLDVVFPLVNVLPGNIRDLVNVV